MEVKNITPPTAGFLQVKLEKVTIDYLWRIVENSKQRQTSYKEKLAGNISKSFLIYDIDSYFFETVCIPLVQFYRRNNKYIGDPSTENAILGDKFKLILDSIWVNYQYQTEFNPYHHHSGVYSFAIWLKIPYNSKDQQQQPQFSGIKKDEKKAGNFEFEYIDSLGDIKNISYKLSSKYEGTMLFFPARLRHCVYPFYGTNEPRISIAGNLFYSNS